MSGDPTYSEQEAEEILRLASRSTGEGISRERLLRMAEELGIPPEAVAAATDTVLTQRTELAERREFVAAQRRSFFNHLMSYIIVNLGLVAINVVTQHRITWAIWSILGWGIGVAMQASQTFFPGSEGHEQEFQKWRAARASGQSYQFDGAKVGHQVTRTTQDVLTHVEAIALRDNLTKLEAIKQVRDETGVGLKDAKDAVDEFERQNPGIFLRG